MKRMDVEFDMAKSIFSDMNGVKHTMSILFSGIN